MKRALLFSVAVLITTFSSAQNYIDDLNTFLSKNVSNGLVDYQNIKDKETEKLTQLISSTNDLLKGATSREQKANYINLYNLLVIKQITDNYPVSSPNEIIGFFDNNKFEVNGQSITLNDLENKVIRSAYNDPRIHFALVCGAIGCPIIQPFAYQQNIIDQQLEQVTKEALNKATFIIKTEEESKVKISKIFQWYIADFGGNKAGIISFINTYATNTIKDIQYYPYNWSLNELNKTVSKTESNVQTYTPSALLKKGQVEIQIFNNLYSQTKFRDAEGIKQSSGQRESWNTMQFTFNYGISKSGRFNLGLDVNLRSTSRGNLDSYAAEIYRFKQDAQNRTTISSLGPKIKWNPFRKIPKFSIQSTLTIPVSDSLETKKNRPWLDHHKYTWWTQLFYDKPIGDKYQLFAEVDFLFRTPTFSKEYDFTQSSLSTPISLFFSYFPTRKSTIYVQYQYAPTITSFPDYFMQAGLGGKYQIFPKLQLELSYTNFFAGQNNGAGNTYNVGLRYIR